tara:strand:+ start:458 stop:649 length:192 start_codon:yes stop_codon:yes gene_type:complete
MNQYKVVTKGDFLYRFEVYELRKGFFRDVWKKVGEFCLESIKESAAERALELINSKKPYYFEA